MAPVQSYIGLGANLGNRFATLTKAIEALNQEPNCTLGVCSPWYETAPMGPVDQPDYLNGVCELTTTLAPLDLLDALQAIEALHGRDRDQPGNRRWGARPLDLDMLLYGDMTIDQPRLSVPHPGIAERSFVLQPLHDIAPELHIPGMGRVATLLQQCETFDIRPASHS